MARNKALESTIGIAQSANDITILAIKNTRITSTTAPLPQTFIFTLCLMGGLFAQGYPPKPTAG